MRADSTEHEMIASLGRHNPRFVDFVRANYQQTLEKMVRCDQNAFLSLQGEAKTLEALLSLLTAK